MNKIKYFFRKIYYHLSIILGKRQTQRIVHSLFIQFMDSNGFHYRTWNHKLHMEAGFQLSQGNRIIVHYHFNPESSLFTLHSHFLTIHSDQIPQTALLIAHLNSMLLVGKLMINFQSRAIYFELEKSYTEIILHPELIEKYHRKAITMPEDLLWCFDQVLENKEDPVIVIGDLIRKLDL